MYTAKAQDVQGQLHVLGSAKRLGLTKFFKKQVRGYFLVFVQLLEKYGTLIERYTALIEKVSPCKGWDQAQCLADPEHIIGVVVHYTGGGTDIASVELDAGQTISQPALLGALSALATALAEPLARAGQLRILDQSEQVHAVLAAAGKWATNLGLLAAVEQLCSAKPLLDGTGDAEVSGLLPFGEAGPLTAALVMRAVKEDPRLLGSSSKAQLALMCAASFVGWHNKLQRALGKDVTPRPSDLLVQRHESGTASLAAGITASQKFSPTTLVQFLDGKLQFVAGKIQAGQEPTRQQLAQFFKSLAASCSKAQQSASSDLANVLVSSFDAIGWDLLRNRSSCSEPPSCQAVLGFLHKLIFDLLSFLPKSSHGLTGSTKAGGAAKAQANPRGALLVAGEQISDHMIQSIIKRLVSCAELAKHELLPSNAQGAGAWVERVVWQGKPIGIALHWESPPDADCDGSCTKFGNLLSSHLAMVVDEFKERSFLYLQPADTTPLPNSDPVTAAAMTPLTWGEIRQGPPTCAAPIPTSTLAPLPATDDTPYRENAVDQHPAAAGSWKDWHAKVAAVLAEHTKSTGIKIDLLPVTDLLTFGWYRICAQACLPMLLALDTNTVEPGMEPEQWMRGMLAGVQQCFLQMDLSDMLVGMLQVNVVRMILAHAHMCCALFLCVCNVMLLVHLRFMQAPGQAGDWLFSAITNAECDCFDGLADYATIPVGPPAASDAPRTTVGLLGPASRSEEDAPLTPEYVAKLPEPAQKQYVGEELYARVLAGTKQPALASKVTGMLLEMDTSILLDALVVNEELLIDLVAKAVDTLGQAERVSAAVKSCYAGAWTAGAHCRRLEAFGFGSAAATAVAVLVQPLGDRGRPLATGIAQTGWIRRAGSKGIYIKATSCGEPQPPAGVPPLPPAPPLVEELFVDKFGIGAGSCAVEELRTAAGDPLMPQTSSGATTGGNLLPRSARLVGDGVATAIANLASFFEQHWEAEDDAATDGAVTLHWVMWSGGQFAVRLASKCQNVV
eukprot:SAG31_NODE_2102_length_6442_cov_1.702507_2_plen_1015_part_00